MEVLKCYISGTPPGMVTPPLPGQPVPLRATLEKKLFLKPSLTLWYMEDITSHPQWCCT